jgi:hypothetical protein
MIVATGAADPLDLLPLLLGEPVDPPRSIHELRRLDRVVRDGLPGVVTAAGALYAMVRWGDGSEEEVEQLHPAVLVEGRIEEVFHA